MIDFRKKYYDLLEEKGVDDVLRQLPNLPYSRKFSIIEGLLDTFSPAKINKALHLYEHSYIQLDKVNYICIDNVIKGLCD